MGASSSSISIKKITKDDWPDVARIFQEALDTGNSSFETSPASSYEVWMENKYEDCCIIARETSTGDALGWACLSTTSKRTVFRGVAELSVYICTAHHGKRIATQLLDHLFPLSEASNIWTIQSGIFPENTISLKMHEKYGFREVGRREKIGLMEMGPYKGQWRDIILLERRSKVAGVN